MTQVKKGCKKPKNAVKQRFNLADNYRKLSQTDQLGVQNFFSLHNAAHWVYDKVSPDAQKYIVACIQMNSAANTIEMKGEESK